MKVRAFLGLGSNIGDRSSHLCSAIRSLRALDSTLAVSRVYESAPLDAPPGDAGGGRYLNCVVCFETDLSPHALLALAHSLEDDAGRVRTVPNAARTLDVDVLLVGDLEVDAPDLVVPHPRMASRGFVLAPLEDLDPALVEFGWRERLATTDPVSLDVRPVGTLACV